jgi:predicted enzyme related to lactoylglutathione lyase
MQPATTGCALVRSKVIIAATQLFLVRPIMNLNQVTLPSLDVARGAAFYKRLGFTQIVEDLPKYARFECRDGGATFSLHVVERLTPSHTIIYFECDDLDATCGTLRKQGIEFEQNPKDEEWLWREAYLRDPDGNRICLYHAGEARRFPPWRLPAAAEKHQP